MYSLIANYENELFFNFSNIPENVQENGKFYENIYVFYYFVINWETIMPETWNLYLIFEKWYKRFLKTYGLFEEFTIKKNEPNIYWKNMHRIIERSISININ